MLTSRGDSSPNGSGERSVAHHDEADGKLGSPWTPGTPHRLNAPDGQKKSICVARCSHKPTACPVRRLSHTLICTGLEEGGSHHVNQLPLNMPRRSEIFEVESTSNEKLSEHRDVISKAVPNLTFGLVLPSTDKFPAPFATIYKYSCGRITLQLCRMKILRTGCGCDPLFSERIRRTVWMRLLLPNFRAYNCVICSTRFLALNQAMKELVIQRRQETAKIQTAR